MSKKSAIVKWISRLKGYDYINPDDEGIGGIPPPSGIDDDDLGKPIKKDAANSGPLDKDKEPKAGIVKRGAE